MDLMSLVNLESTDQKGGYECQAKQYLENGTVAAGIDCTNKVLWVFFDREAISELQASNEEDEETNNSSLTWMDHLDYMEDYSDDFDPIIGKMIGNHTEISKPFKISQPLSKWLRYRPPHLELLSYSNYNKSN